MIDGLRCLGKHETAAHAAYSTEYFSSPLTPSVVNLPFEPLLIPTGVVALAEIGDKTQLLALVLAARYREPVAISLGIAAATLANHAVAGALGGWISSLIPLLWLHRGLAVSFLAMAIWTLVPDRLSDKDTHVTERFGVFGTTTIAFFLAEMGDKTQVATIALVARYDAPALVVIGTTVGMLIANIPVVLLGGRLSGRLPIKYIRMAAAVLFAALGLGTLWSLWTR
jgi:putative Ca2+/H+ antiporter (TMEM165/GDT1 family)